MVIVGVDIGGTHATAARVQCDGARYRVGDSTRRPVDSGGAAEEILLAWCTAIRAACPPAEIAALGLAMPGPFDYPRGICLIQGVAKYEGLYGMDIGAAFRARLGLAAQVPIVFDNDCNCFVFGEWLAGAARGHGRVVGITLGTGLGAGFVADGAIQWSGPGVPRDAELYWVPYRDSTAEEQISRRGLRRLYQERGGPAAHDVADIAAAARTGDARARGIFDELGVMIADVLAPWLGEFRADVLVIGGAMVRSFDLFGGTVQARLAPRSVVPAALPDTAGLLGAAVLAERALPAR